MNPSGQILIGIRCEDKSAWERRAPLSPKEVQKLLQSNPQLRFIVQPSAKRVWSDFEYEQHGAIMQQDLSECRLIIGIKEIPPQKLLPDKTYLYFSHTIKAQKQNMPALDTILAKKIRLIDYEKITDAKGQRLIAFGKYAGMAGALDFLKGLGEYLMVIGYNTPLLHANCSYKYFDLEDAYKQLTKIAEQIKDSGLPTALLPVIFGITGSGRTADGCLDILRHLPVSEIKAEEVEALMKDPHDARHRRTIYIVRINTQDCIEPLDPHAKFDKQQYYLNPNKYQCVFHCKFLPHLTALFHCIFWDPKYPRYITNQHLANLAQKKMLRLLGICDVTCDLGGSIECLKKYTDPEKPFFYYDPIGQKYSYELAQAKNKILYSAMDFLPCELAMDSSLFFSDKLSAWIPCIASSKHDVPLEEQSLIPELKRAVIATGGSLTPDFEYIFELRKENEAKALANTLVQKKQAIDAEVDPTNSMNPYGVAVPGIIEGEKLDFSDV